MLLGALAAGRASLADSDRQPERLAAIRLSGDIVAQRAHLWQVFDALTQPVDGAPRFEGWDGEAALFGASGPQPGMAGFRRPRTAFVASSGAPVIAYSLYNPAAVAHIGAQALSLEAGLDSRRAAGERRVPEFPREAIVAKTVWWPVARDGVTALPVWDADLNPPSPDGNPYLTWRRVVAVDPAEGTAPVAEVQLVGRTVTNARRFGLSAFHSATVDARLAANLGADEEANRTALLVLGRPVAAGDHLILVGINVMTRELEDWVWGAFWWHDRPEAGAFAQGRPGDLAGPWRHFLMQAAFDAETPRAADGGAHVCFNPWLEGRFPDAGRGGGTASNCVACHARASYPAQPFLPVTRGRPQADDPALSPDRLRTSFLWSLPLHARPR